MNDMRRLCLAQDPATDQLLSENPFALLVGMSLDQHSLITTVAGASTQSQVE